MSETGQIEQYTVVDKSTWPRGVWDDEPDRLEFISDGFACLAVRDRLLGHWHGFVGVPVDNPVYGLRADQLMLTEGVHCGIQFAGRYVPGESASQCGLWWFGFSCGGADDLSPGLPVCWHDSEEIPSNWIQRALKRITGGKPLRDMYRDQGYVVREIESLAHQLRALSG